MRISGFAVAAGLAFMVGGAGPRGPEQDITGTHGFADAKLCTFRPAGEATFEALSRLRFRRSVAVRRDVGGVSFAIEGRRIETKDSSGYTSESRTTVAMPVQPAHWHGLRVTGFAAGHERPAESDSMDWREVRLAASPVQVRRALRSLGVNVPTDGYFSANPGAGCGEEVESPAITVGRVAGGASIRCETGC